MAAQNGTLVLIAIGDGGSPSETFTTIGGQMTTTMGINNEIVEVTNKDSANRARELLRIGLKTWTMSGESRFLDDAATTTLLTYAMSSGNTFTNFQMTIPDLGTFTGPFEVATMEFTGEDKQGATYSTTFESAAEITFAAA